MTDQQARERAERIVWPGGKRGGADEMGYHIRNLDILAQRITRELLAAHRSGELAGMKRAATIADSGCSCTHPCEDYNTWPNTGCPKVIGNVIRAAMEPKHE